MTGLGSLTNDERKFFNEKLEFHQNNIPGDTELSELAKLLSATMDDITSFHKEGKTMLIYHAKNYYFVRKERNSSSCYSIGKKQLELKSLFSTNLNITKNAANIHNSQRFSIFIVNIIRKFCYLPI